MLWRVSICIGLLHTGHDVLAFEVLCEKDNTYLATAWPYPSYGSGIFVHFLKISALNKMNNNVENACGSVRQKNPQC
jgi:hypothetical protein